MANKIRVVSDGTPAGTRVFACNRENGVDVELSDILKIEFGEIAHQVMPTVRLTFFKPEIDILAELEE